MNLIELDHKEEHILTYLSGKLMREEPNLADLSFISDKTGHSVDDIHTALKGLQSRHFVYYEGNDPANVIITLRSRGYHHALGLKS